MISCRSSVMPASELQSSPIRADDRPLVSGLLARIAGSVDGLVDTGTALCLSGAPAATRQGFLRWRGEALRAHVVVLKDVLGSASRTGPFRARVATLGTDVDHLLDALTVL